MRYLKCLVYLSSLVTWRTEQLCHFKWIIYIWIFTYRLRLGSIKSLSNYLRVYAQRRFKVLMQTAPGNFRKDLSSIRNQVYNQNLHLNASQFRRVCFFFLRNVIAIFFFFFFEFFFCWVTLSDSLVLHIKRTDCCRGRERDGEARWMVRPLETWGRCVQILEERA